MTTCYVGCDFTGKLVTHAPHVAPLALTGTNLTGEVLIGAIIIFAGALFLLAESKIRKFKP